VLAVQAAGLDQLYPDAGMPWQPRALYLATHPHSAAAALRDVIGARRAAYSVPDEQIDERLDVTPELEAKIGAVLAHRSEAERGAVPGLVAAASPAARAAMLSTEWYIRSGPWPAPTARAEG
jgi:N-acetyl-1-D-myo-inositol-2-amino-2-deoxy-alpha-D-glucopyranoside deacetylase